MALVTFPDASWVSGTDQVRHSPPGRSSPTKGMIMSSTMALTTLPTAAPITTPTARARAFCSSRTSLKSSARLMLPPQRTPDDVHPGPCDGRDVPPALLRPLRLAEAGVPPRAQRFSPRRPLLQSPAIDVPAS